MTGEIHGAPPAPTPSAGPGIVPADGVSFSDDDEFDNAMRALAAIVDAEETHGDARSIAEAILEAIGSVTGTVAIDIRHINPDGKMTTATIKLGGA